MLICTESTGCSSRGSAAQKGHGLAGTSLVWRRRRPLSKREEGEVDNNHGHIDRVDTGNGVASFHQELSSNVTGGAVLVEAGPTIQSRS